MTGCCDDFDNPNRCSRGGAATQKKPQWRCIASWAFFLSSSRFESRVDFVAKADMVQDAQLVCRHGESTHVTGTQGLGLQSPP